jgi:hypothetical protein
VATSPTPSAGPSSSPIRNETTDGTFSLALAAAPAVAEADEPLDVTASLTYLGPEARTTIHHGGSVITFWLEEVDGRRVMDAASTLECRWSELVAGEPLHRAFSKSGSPTDDPAAGFDRAWYQDPRLVLPTGGWRISAFASAEQTDCGVDPRGLATSVDITVRPG